MKSTVERIEEFASALKEYYRKKENPKAKPMTTPTAAQFELNENDFWVKKTVESVLKQTTK